MAKTTARLRKVPATTNNITRGIINFLNVRGNYAFRVNSTGIWDPTKQVIRRPNSPRGIADIICCLAPGLFLAIEVKNKLTGDRPSKMQENFAQEIRQAGGIYVIATGYKSFIDWFLSQPFTKKEG